MIDDIKPLQQTIRQYVHLDTKPNNKGWYPVLCKVCGDRGHKGKRAAFKFDEDITSYHCFNCGIATGYDPQNHERVPRKIKKVLSAFGLPDDELQKLELKTLANRDAGMVFVNSKDKPIDTIPVVLDIPNTFYSLKDASNDDPWAEIATDYLAHDRGVDPDSYPFMLAHKSQDFRLNKWCKRLIIPIYKDNQLIYWQGRDLTGTAVKKYESPPAPKDRVLYGFDQLFNWDERPLYITEGWFDAHAVGGVAILGNEITKAQLAWLHKSPRTKVYIPDKSGDGKRAALVALEQGWNIAIPDTPGTKDMSEAVHKYGKLFVRRSLVENTSSGFDAELRLSLFVD